MEQTEMIKWAIKGLRSEIDLKEKQVRECKRWIISICEGDGYYKGVMFSDEIENHIKELNEEIEVLFNKMQNLRWELVD